MADPSVRFDMKRGYAREALMSPDMRGMINKKMKLAESLYFRRAAKRTGQNARSRRSEIIVGGEKRGADRFEGRLIAYAPHALAREFGRVKSRGGKYSQEVADRYGRSVRGRATQRGPAEHVLGGDNRRLRSVVATLESQ